MLTCPHSPDTAKVGFPAQFFDVRALKLVSGLLGLGQLLLIPQTGSLPPPPLGVLTHSRMPSLSPGPTLAVIHKIPRSTEDGPCLILGLEMPVVPSQSFQCGSEPVLVSFTGIYLVPTACRVLGFVHELEQGWGVRARVTVMAPPLRSHPVRRQAAQNWDREPGTGNPAPGWRDLVQKVCHRQQRRKGLPRSH